MPDYGSIGCWAVMGSDFPSGNLVSAAAILVPESRMRTLGIALNDQVEIRTESFVCIGCCIPQPHSSSGSESDLEVVLLTSIPYRGYYDLPAAALQRVAATLHPLQSALNASEIVLETDSDLSNSSILKFLNCQRLLVRPRSEFMLRHPENELIRCTVVQCRPEAGCITKRTLIQVQSRKKQASIAAKINANVARDAILGASFVRLCSFLKMPLWKPKGILIHGPTGTGKSLMVEVAGCATNLSIRYISGNDLSAMPSPGDAERSLAQVFESALDIVCIDDIDAISKKRGNRQNESSQTLGQLLTLMAGVNSKNIVVIGLTTKPNELDAALRRPGRFDQEIEVTVPDVHQRTSILQFYLPGINADNARRIAERSVGYTGSDLYSLAQECALAAAFSGRLEISDEDIACAFRRVCLPSSRRGAIVKVPCTEWTDIGGYDSVKTKLRRLIEWPIKHPDKYRYMGLQLPRGLLLYGPPGCAKTTLARALVSSSSDHWSILKLDAASVYSSFVGDAEAAIRRVFTQARANLPCMILLDEIDSIVTSRGLHSSGSERVQERILSTLLNEMDGIAGSDQILVVASTNRPQMLDEALLRPGRLDHLFFVDLPDSDGRFDILKVHTRSMPLAPDIDLAQYAQTKLNFFTGAEIENVCREAALHALRLDIDSCIVSKSDFDYAISKIQPGMTPELLRPYHEFSGVAGHRK